LSAITPCIATAGFIARWLQLKISVMNSFMRATQNGGAAWVARVKRAMTVIGGFVL
jgi:hypothetical protein